MIVQADARHIPLADNSVQCCVTSPPYWGLRDYGVNGQLGLERTPEEYVANMVAVFREVRRVLREDGTCWVNLGDSYASGGSGGYSDKSTLAGFTNPNTKGRVMNADSMQRRAPDGLKPKDLVGIPWRIAFALQADGWYLRADIIWAKPNPMPESVTDRPTKSHEYIFLLTKSAKYFFDQEAVREPHETTVHRLTKPTTEYAHGLTPEQVAGRKVQRGGKALAYAYTDGVQGNPNGRNLRSVWSIATQPYPEAHFATFPEEIPKRCILAGTSARGCCAACGAPWERVVERYVPAAYPDVKYDTSDPRYATKRNMGQRYQDELNAHPPKTTGFRPTCTCNTGTVPCIVLDPFSGSGTTIAVAESLGRRGIGLELKPEYIALARKRTRTVTIGLPL